MSMTLLFVNGGGTMITPGEVLPTDTAEVGGVFSGGTVTAGMPVYRDVSDGHRYKPADSGSAVTADVAGIAMCNSSNGQPLVIATGGDIDPGFTCVVGETYAAAPTGFIRRVSDMPAGEYVTVLGTATNNSNLKLEPFPGGTARA